MEQTQEVKVNNKHYRISGRQAMQYELPEHIWYVQMSKEIIKPISGDLRTRVPLNWTLIDNLRKEPVKNPILVGIENWIYVGSQRMRALQWLAENEDIDMPVLVCRFQKNPLAIWKLWGGTDGAKCAAIQVQIWETLFKSLYYPVDTTIDGKPMYEFEEQGDKMYWSIRDDDPFWSKKENGGRG